MSSAMIDRTDSTGTERPPWSVHEGSAAVANYPIACIHELIEEQVEQTPDAVALRCGDQQLTYRALNARANQLARYLRTRCVGIDTPVGICLEPSLDAAIAA